MTVWNTVLLSVLCFLALDMYHLKLINPHFSPYTEGSKFVKLIFIVTFTYGFPNFPEV